MIPACSYLRVSTRSQIGADRDGFDRQDEAIAKYCQANALEYLCAFVEYGVCGDNDVDDREAFPALIEYVGNGGPKIVVIENPDRLARRLIVSEVVLREFHTMGVQVITASGTVLTGDDTDDPERAMIRQILAAVAQADKNRLIQRLRSGRRKKKRSTGRCEGQAPYGQTDEEISTLKSMRDMRAQKMSDARIAEALNQAGVRTRHGKNWSRQNVARILNRRPAKVN